MKLSEAKAGYNVRVTSISGNHHLLSRLIGIGLAEGIKITVLQNIKGQPVIFYCRDSMIALSPKDCNKIEVTQEDPS